jgi:hypothetical protein
VDIKNSREIDLVGMIGTVTSAVGGGMVKLANSIPPNARVKVHVDSTTILDNKGPLQSGDIIKFDHIAMIGPVMLIQGNITVMNR